MSGIFGASRISLSELAALSERLSTQLAAGIDLRRIWQHEVESARGGKRRPYAAVRSAVDRGETFAEALRGAGHFFPPAFCELVEVGEQSGHLAEMFTQLSENYTDQIELRRKFRGEMTYPIIQSVLAAAIIGGLIWLMGLLRESTKQDIDLLGLNLYGTRGLMIYLGTLAGAAVTGLVSWQIIRHGLLRTRAFQALILHLPVLSIVLKKLALSRLTWSLYLTLDAGMDPPRALALALHSTDTWRYADQIEPICQSVREGRELHEAMAATHVFPVRITDAVAVGERSGRLAGTMHVLSNQYKEESRAALGLLTRLAGVGMWLGVSATVVFFIFRIAFFYLGILNEVTSSKF